MHTPFNRDVPSGHPPKRAAFAQMRANTVYTIIVLSHKVRGMTRKTAQCNLMYTHSRVSTNRIFVHHTSRCRHCRDYTLWNARRADPLPKTHHSHTWTHEHITDAYARGLNGGKEGGVVVVVAFWAGAGAGEC